MLSANDAKIIRKMKQTWFEFKKSRNSKINSNKIPSPWLSILQREQYIDELFRLLEKCKKKIEIYE